MAATSVLRASLKFPKLHREAVLGLINVSLKTDDRASAQGWARVAIDEYPELTEDEQIRELLSQDEVDD